MARSGRSFPAGTIIRSQPPSAVAGGTGDVSITFGAAALLSAGAVSISGDAPVVLGAAAMASAGVVAIAGGANIALGTLISAATGALAIAANASIGLGAVRLSSNNSSAGRWAKRRFGIGISMHGN